MPLAIDLLRYSQLAVVEHIEYLGDRFFELGLNVMWSNVSTTFECLFNGTLQLIHDFP